MPVDDAGLPADDSPATPESTARSGLVRRWTIRIVLVCAVVVGMLGSIVTWADHQVLDADNWSATSEELLANDNIRHQLATYLVDQLYENVDVEEKLSSRLPDALSPLSKSAAQGVHGASEDVAESLLGQKMLRDAWRTANRIAMQQVINVVNGHDDGVVSGDDGKIFVNARPMLAAVAKQTGIPAQALDRLPDHAGRFTVLTSESVTTVQHYGRVMQGLVLILPILCVALFGLAVWLARGRRRQALFASGVGIVVIGAFLVVARMVIVEMGTARLAGTDALRPAVDAALSIATEMVPELGWSIIVAGLAVILATAATGQVTAFERNGMSNGSLRQDSNPRHPYYK